MIIMNDWLCNLQFDPQRPLLSLSADNSPPYIPLHQFKTKKKNSKRKYLPIYLYIYILKKKRKKDGYYIRRKLEPLQKKKKKDVRTNIYKEREEEWKGKEGKTKPNKQRRRERKDFLVWSLDPKQIVDFSLLGDWVFGSPTDIDNFFFFPKPKILF